MPPLPPIPPPTDTIENLGPDKVDLDRAPDDVHYLKASEWNSQKRYTKWLYDAYIALSLTGSTGTLWDAYQNHALGPNINPARVYLDFNIGSVVFTDDAAPLGKLLLGVSDNAGGGEYGFWSQGLRLRDGIDAIHTAGNVAIRMRSSRTAAAGAAYRLDTVNPYTISQNLYELNNGASPLMAVTGGGTLSFFHILDSSLLWRMQPAYDGTGKIRLVSGQPGGASLAPQSSGVGRLGDSFDPWKGVHALYHASQRQPRPFAASMTIDAAAGEWWETILTADLTISAIGNAQIGSILTLSFWQDPTGGRQLASLPADVVTNGPFSLTPDPGRNDTLTLRFSGFEWIEIGRRQHNSPERRVRERSIDSGIVELKAGLDAHLQSFEGVLVAAADIKVMQAGAAHGDRFEVVFSDAIGVTTDLASPLSIVVDGGPTLAVFNQAKTLKGRLLLYHNGTTWKPAGLSTLSYI